MTYLARALLAALSLVLPGVSFCAAEAPHASPASADARWSAFVDGFLQAHFAANPTFAVTSGRHEYDGQLPDYSADALQAEIARLQRARSDITAFDGAQLGQDARFERDYLAAVIDEQLFWRMEAQWPSATRRTTSTTSTRIRISQAVRTARAAHARVHRLCAGDPTGCRADPRESPHADAGRVDRIRHERVRRVCGFLRERRRGDLCVVKDASLQADLRDGQYGAAAAMRELGGWLASQRATATSDFAIGAALFSRMLEATEQVRLPLERVAEIGRADLARNTEALASACRQLLPHGTVAECVARVRSRKAADGPVALARRQLPELEAFVRQSGIVTIPSDEQALVASAPPYNAQNFAYIIVPGPYETNVPATYYIAPPDPRWTPSSARSTCCRTRRCCSRRCTRYGRALPAVPAFEPLPLARRPALHGLRVRRGLGALHRGADVGLGLHAGDPEAHVGQLLQALWRDVRYVSAIGLHTGTLTVADSERLFREQAWLDAGNAHQQALRGAYDPGTSTTRSASS
jgi:hypothetical protein